MFHAALLCFDLHVWQVNHPNSSFLLLMSYPLLLSSNFVGGQLGYRPLEGMKKCVIKLDL